MVRLTRGSRASRPLQNQVWAPYSKHTIVQVYRRLWFCDIYVFSVFLSSTDIDEFWIHYHFLAFFLSVR